MELRRQGTLVAGGKIGVHMAALAHAGDDGADIGVVEDEAQGHFRHGHAVPQERLECVRARDAGFEIFGNKIRVAPILLRPGALESERAGQ